MSDFDRNVAARGFGATGTAAAIDVGLPAYMIRIYNYMAAGVALTGVVSWFTFNAATTTNEAGRLVLTSFGQAIYSGPLTIILFLGTLGIGTRREHEYTPDETRALEKVAEEIGGLLKLPLA